MKPRLLPAGKDMRSDLGALMETLLQTGRGIEKLTESQVDTVSDRDGRILLLRGIREQLHTNDVARQAAILNALATHIALLDVNGVIVTVNEAWLQFGIGNAMRGLKGGVGESYFDICDRAAGDGVPEAKQAAEGIRSVLDGLAMTFSFEYSCHSPTEQRWFQLVATPLRKDRLAGAVVMHVDITERMRMERAADANQKRLRDLIDGLGPSMFVGLMTPDGILVEANRPALAATGLRPEDVIGKPFVETYWWIRSPIAQQKLRDAILRAKEGVGCRFDVQVHAPDFRLIDIDFSLQPVRNDAGEVVLLVPSASVITDRKDMEKALHASHENFAQLAANISDVFWVRSPDGSKVEYLSPAFERVWGRSVASLQESPSEWGEFVVPEDRERVLAVFATLSEEASSIELEYRIARPNGEIRWIRLRGFQVRNASGELVRLTGIAADITEAHRAAEELQTRFEEFRTLAEAMPQMVWITASDGLAIYFSQQWMGYTGLTLEESLGAGWNKPIHPDDQQRAWAAWRHATATTSVYNIECRLRRADNVYRWWLFRGIPHSDASGKVLKWFGTCTDIHDMKLTEEALFVEKENAQIRLSSIGDALICTDVSGNINFLNSAAEKLLGWSFQEASGKPLADAFQLKDAAIDADTSDRQLPANCVFIRRDGNEIPIEGSVATIHDREGRSNGRMIVVRDVTLARAMALHMSYLIEHDALTDLPNRLLFRDRLNQAIALAARHKKCVAVLFIDLDGFKHINDSLGHAVGDKMIQAIGKRLQGCIRSTDTVSRQGGDEFVMLLSELEGPEDAALLAGKALRVVADPHSIDGYDLQVTASIGVSLFPDDGCDAETLVKNADTAMYQAKENGRQRQQFFKPAMNIRAVERQSIEAGLRRALERREFILNYQPKVNLMTGQIVGAEALVRWAHPTRGLVPPAQFIPVAESCGLIAQIGNWVLREACRQTREWADAGLPALTMAVNVSAMELGIETFPEGVLAILKANRLDPGLLQMELTESVLMGRAEVAALVLKELRASGVQVAIDDFGTGYSSLSYLRKFPIDALKIDQSFVREISLMPDDTTIVRAIIGIGHSLKLKVIAEGVETQTDLALLQAHHCDEGQGYYFSRPVPHEEFAKLLQDGIPGWPRQVC